MGIYTWIVYVRDDSNYERIPAEEWVEVLQFLTRANARLAVEAIKASKIPGQRVKIVHEPSRRDDFIPEGGVWIPHYDTESYLWEVVHTTLCEGFSLAAFSEKGAHDLAAYLNERAASPMTA